MAHDLLMIPLAWYCAYWFRYNLDGMADSMILSMNQALIVLVPVQAVIFWRLGLYRGVWRFASMPDLVRIIKAVAIGVTASLFVLFVTTRLSDLPRSIPILYGLLLFVCLAGPRFLYRWRKDHRLYSNAGKRVLIIGAGRAGEMLVRDLLNDVHSTYEPVAFVDDDKKK
ncbi:MAG: polysaccharide biosynthesis protein, partial [Gammaproteobacteria bacterium]|nr:polysaccharide biosynthesis protein [Gammaproteobacteria bacterium]